MKLRYFAWVRERVGKPEEDIEIPAGVKTVGQLMTWLAGRGEEYAHAFDNPKVIRAAIDRPMSTRRRRSARPLKSPFSRR